MSSADSPSEPTPRKNTKARKKAPGHFKGGNALVQGLLAGADDVAGRSFLGGGMATAEEQTPAAPEAVEPSDGRAALPVQATESAAAASAPAGERRAATSPSPPKSPPPAKQPLPAPTTAPAREREAAGAESSAASRRQARSGAPWAHTAVHESFADAKIRSEQWTSHGFRIEPETLTALKERIKADRRTSGNTMLGQGHYVDAALRHIPDDVEAQIAMARGYLSARMGYVQPSKQSTFRVGPQAYDLISNLNLELMAADYGRRGLFVVSAAVEQLLHALEEEGDLARPERRHS